MPNWNEILDDIRTRGSVHDVVRREYLRKVHEVTGRNVIIYYSAWLQKPEQQGPLFAINDNDINGLMSTVNKLDRSLGLDLVLHTPGGETAATEAIVSYLRKMFGTEMRAIIPQLAMSAGTMISCACKSVLMGKQSSLGPIDPQLGGFAAHGVIEEFKQAAAEIKADPTRIPLWQPIIARYAPTLIGECQKAIAWSEQMVRDWLMSGMLAGDSDAVAKADKIVSEFGSHALTLSHGRHLSAERCHDAGLVVERLEDNQELQDAVLSLHHACIHTLTSTAAIKIIENHAGVAFIQTQQIAIQMASR